MGKLIYAMGPTSLDGYVADREGDFNWANPGVDLHIHAGAELARASSTIYGRKIYHLMAYWETADQSPELPPASIEFAKSWQALDKIVVSRTLTEAQSKRTRIVPRLSADDIRKLKAESTKPIMLSGPTAASPFLNEGLVDEVSAYFMPIAMGGGLPLFKDIERPIRLEQIEEQSLTGGLTFVRYTVRKSA
jgi:dihydrofolate reductase